MPQKIIKKQFLEGQLRFFRSTADELLFSGAFGAGKSRILCEKCLFLAMKYPGVKIGIFRKTAISLTRSTLETFLEICPKDYIESYNKTLQVILLKNGSKLTFGGMDDPGKWGSTEFGIIACDELIEFAEEDYNMLLGRLRQTLMVDDSGVERYLPFRQIMGATNPGSPTHWLYKRAFVDHLMEVYEGKTRDNRFNPPSYLRLMEKLKGRYHDRYVEGLWVGFEGAVYDNFDPLIHLIPPKKIKPEWRKIRAVDFGFNDPFVCLWLAVGDDGEIYVYRQLYGSFRLVEDWGRKIKLLSEGENIEATVCDWDREDRMTLERYTEDPTVEAYKDILMGIQLVHRRLDVVNATSRLYVFENSLVEKDEELEFLKKPLSLEDELPGYAWQKTKEGKPNKEEPIDFNNHALDALRYGVSYLEDSLPAEGVIIYNPQAVYDANTY